MVGLWCGDGGGLLGPAANGQCDSKALRTRPVPLPPTANLRETGWMRQMNSAGCLRDLGGTTT